MLRHGLEAGDLRDEQVEAIEAHARTGRPLGSEAFVDELEAATGRQLKRRKPGPRPKGATS
jgi:putative transposase